jgi:hypothetical protein
LSSGLGGLTVCPGGVFAIERVVAQAAVQDADESIAEGTQGLMVKVSGGAVLIVERSGTRLLFMAPRAHWSMAS